MGLPLVAALIQGGMGIGGNMLSNSMQNAANMKMAKWQNEKNIEMWQMNNAYNSPAEQMKRFRAAGLNPHLIYGQGTAGNSPSAPRFEAPEQISNVKVPEVLSNYYDMRMKEAQIDNVNAQKRNTDALTTINLVKAMEAEDWKQFIERSNMIKSQSQQEGLWRLVASRRVGERRVAYQDLLNKGLDLNVQTRGATMGSEILKRNLEVQQLKLRNELLDYERNYKNTVNPSLSRYLDYGLGTAESLSGIFSKFKGLNKTYVTNKYFGK